MLRRRPGDFVSSRALAKASQSVGSIPGAAGLMKIYSGVSKELLDRRKQCSGASQESLDRRKYYSGCSWRLWNDRHSALDALRRRWIDEDSILHDLRRRWIDESIILGPPGRFPSAAGITGMMLFASPPRLTAASSVASNCYPRPHLE